MVKHFSSVGLISVALERRENRPLSTRPEQSRLQNSIAHQSSVRQGSHIHGGEHPYFEQHYELYIMRIVLIFFVQ